MIGRWVASAFALAAVLGMSSVGHDHPRSATILENLERHEPYDLVLAGGRGALLGRDQWGAGALALGDTGRGWTHAEIPAPDLPGLDSLVERGLVEGALGVGFGIAYTPGASREEILRLFRIAARHSVPCFVHLREGGRDPATGGSVAALQEVIADAAATGAALHVV